VTGRAPSSPPKMKTPRHAPVLPLALLAAACGGGGDDSSGGAPVLAAGDPLTTYVGYDRDGGLSSLLRGDERFASSFGVILGETSAGGAALDYFGNAYHAEIRPFDAAIVVLWTMREREFDNGRGVVADGYDREILGFSTTLSEPRNVAIAHGPGLLMVTDTGDGQVKVWGTAASGDVPPLFTSTPAAAPWDLAYDEGADRLFASLVDGTIAVFDDFVQTQPAAPTRTITPSDDGATAAVADLRGIALDPIPGSDRLFVTAPGAEASGNDGRVFAIDGASVATGLVQVTAEIDLPFAEPLDVALFPDGRARIADLERRRLIVAPYDALALDGADPATVSPLPRLERPLDSPRAIALEPEDPVRTVGSVSDIEDPMTPLAGLLVASNAAGMPATVELVDESLAGGAALRTFDYDRPAAGVAIDALGDAYVSTGDGTSGAVTVVHRFATERGTMPGDTLVPSRDRDIVVPGGFFGGPTFEDPRGFDIDSTSDLLVVADAGLPGVLVLGRTAGADAAFADILQDGFAESTAEPVDVEYDAVTDRLFVSVSNGAVYVYDAFVFARGDMPDRIITPSDMNGAAQVSTSLGAIEYDAAQDLLFVGEVGAASGVGPDGAIYLFQSASTAGGLTPPDAIVDGAVTGLDDPLSFAWNGDALWVADPAVGVISRFDGAAGLMGATAPSATLAAPDVRAIALVPEGLAPATGGSILAD